MSAGILSLVASCLMRDLIFFRDCSVGGPVRLGRGRMLASQKDSTGDSSPGPFLNQW